MHLDLVAWNLIEFARSQFVVRGLLLLRAKGGQRQVQARKEGRLGENANDIEAGTNGTPSNDVAVRCVDGADQERYADANPRRAFR